MDNLPSHAGSYNNIVVLISEHRTFCGLNCVCIVQPFELLHRRVHNWGKTLYGYYMYDLKCHLLKGVWLCSTYTSQRVTLLMVPDVIIIYRGLLSLDITSAYINLCTYICRGNIAPNKL